MGKGQGGMLAFVLSVFVLGGVLTGCTVDETPESTTQVEKEEMTDTVQEVAKKPDVAFDEAVQIIEHSEDRVIASLPNRMVLVAMNVDTAPVVSVNCFVKNGLIFQHKPEYIYGGISHYLEHLLSGGTTSNRTEAEVSRTIAEVGARPNAYTSSYEVDYYINGSSEDTAVLVELISDSMRNNLVLQSEVDREKDVILREIDMGRGEANRIFWKLTSQARYKWHPARHPTIGYESEFKKLTRDQLVDYYETMYAPNNLTFVVVGKIDPVKVINQLAAYWKDAEPKELPEIKFPIEAGYELPREVIGFADISKARLRLMWKNEKQGTKDDYALDVLGQILGQGELSRLTGPVRDSGLAVTVDAFNYSTTWGGGFFGVDAQLPQANIEQAVTAIKQEIEKLQTQGVTEEEMARARRQVLARSVYSGQTAQATARRVGTNIMSLGDPDYLDKYVDQINQVTAEDVQRVAQKFLTVDYQTVLLLPATAENPVTQFEIDLNDVKNTPPDDMQYEVYDLDNASVIPKLKNNLQKNASEGLIASQTSEIKLHRLDNGLRVLIQKDNRLPMVAMRWYQLGGLLSDDPGREGVGNAAMTMLRRGAGGMSADEISEVLESLGASLSAQGGNNTWYADAQSLKEDWPRVLALMGDMILEPTFDESEWGKMKPRIIASIKQRDERWSTELNDGFRRLYYGEHQWGAPVVGKLDVVESLTAADLKAFHEKSIGAEHGIIAVFGDVDEVEVLAKVKEIFGKMPAKAAREFTAELPEAHTTGTHVINTAKPTYAVQMGYGPIMKSDDPSYADLLIMNKILDQFPAGWIKHALRGEKGLSYASWSYATTGMVPGYYVIAWNTRSETADEAMNRVMEQLARIQKEPVDQDTFKHAQRGVLVGRSFGMESLGDRATSAALGEIYGQGYDVDTKLIEQLNASNPQRVWDIAKKTLGVEPLIVTLEQEKE